ncbi:MAG: hypothetical protein ACRELB_05900 [Polyangiaceae bacterium]
MSLEAPLDPALPVERGRDAYLAENGFTVRAYEDPWTEASFVGVRFRVPNTQRHRWAIRLHDLHHVATGYGTDLAGEAEISAWELRKGLRGLDAYVGTIVVTAALAGMVFAPRRTIAAWRASHPGRSLFQTERRYEELLAMTVAELRSELGVPERGIASCPRRLHAYAPAPLHA